MNSGRQLHSALGSNFIVMLIGNYVYGISQSVALLWD